jgi:SNF2 family DNA or RNA helicase
MELLTNALDSGHKVLVFSQFTSMLDLLVQAARAQGFSYYLLVGETEEDPWAEDVMQILSEIKDPAMRKLAIDQLKCIARIS